jgi:hypothetical protein
MYGFFRSKELWQWFSQWHEGEYPCLVSRVLAFMQYYFDPELEP